MWKPKKLYSQNFEDLYLWRVFNEKTKGFYIDVGAQIHDLDSVTKIFYDQGWSGINIEPSPILFKELKKNRENDINLSVAAFNKSSIQKFNTYGSTGLGSLKNFHEVNIQDYILDEKKVINVQTATLYEIINTYCNYPNIDFLKIDVEGSEKEVIQGIKFDKLDINKHPRIILVEVNSPNSRLISSQQYDCQKLLANAEYTCFFFDGLNEYYCKIEDKKNLDRITLPPNVFDEIVSTPSGVARGIKQTSKKLEEHIELCNKKEEEKKDLIDQNKQISQKLQEHIELVKEKEVEIKELIDHNKQTSQKLDEQHIELIKEKDAEIKELIDQNKKASQNLEEHIELIKEKEVEIKDLTDQNKQASQKLEEHIELIKEKEVEIKDLADQNKLTSQKLVEHIELCNKKEEEIYCLQKDKDLIRLQLQKDKDLLLSQLHIVQGELELHFLKYTAANVLISSLRKEYDKSVDTISRLIKLNNSTYRLFRNNKVNVIKASIQDN